MATQEGGYNCIYRVSRFSNLPLKDLHGCLKLTKKVTTLAQVIFFFLLFLPLISTSRQFAVLFVSPLDEILICILLLNVLTTHDISCCSNMFFTRLIYSATMASD